MNTTLISAIVAAAIGAAGAWYVQQHRIDTLKLEQQDERVSIQRAARASIERALAQSAKAYSAATTRAVELRQSAAAARTELDGLRESTDASLRAAGESAAACAERATAIGGLFNQCARELQTLAERADRHVSDIKTLTDMFPK